MVASHLNDVMFFFLSHSATGTYSVSVCNRYFDEKVFRVSYDFFAKLKSQAAGTAAVCRPVLVSRWSGNPKIYRHFFYRGISTSISGVLFTFYVLFIIFRDLHLSG